MTAHSAAASLRQRRAAGCVRAVARGYRIPSMGWKRRNVPAKRPKKLPLQLLRQSAFVSKRRIVLARRLTKLQLQLLRHIALNVQPKQIAFVLKKRNVPARRLKKLQRLRSDFRWS